jgi:hypothetical protein
MTNSITLIVSDNLQPTELSQVNKLLYNSFNITVLPHIDKHFILSIGNKIIGYSAVVTRTFSFNKSLIGLFLLGMFTIDVNFRNIGLGTKLLEFICYETKALGANGIILNCGNSIVNFYINSGFIQISNNAIYYRDSKNIIDNDPVLIKPFCNNPILNIQYESIFFGSDF